MGNILFQNNPRPNSQANSISSLLGMLKSMGNSNSVFNQMYNNNPKFRQFADSMKGKTPEQAFSEHGLNFNQFKNFKW